MSSETEQFGNLFESLGREVLMCLNGLPESMLHWPLPLPQGVSLFAHAMHLLEEGAFWVLEVVGGQYLLHDRRPEERSGRTYADLALRFEQWFTQLHRVLDMLPDAALGLFVDVPPPYQDLFGGGTTTIRACLLHAVGQSAVHVGHIQLICQLFADGERMLYEVAECHEMSEYAQDSLIGVGQPGDYS